MNEKVEMEFETPPAIASGPVQVGSILMIFCDKCKMVRPKQYLQRRYSGRLWICLVCGKEISIGE